MSKKLIAVIGAFAATLFTYEDQSHASYTSLQVTSQIAIGGNISYRVYAGFNNANDYLTAVSGSPMSPLVILSRNLDDSGPGGNFVNDEFGPDLTFPAIGSANIGLSPSFPPGSPFITGNSYISANSGWFTPGPVIEGSAGWTGDGDPLLRVLIMQLTVSSTSTVKGTVNISGINNTALAGSQSFTITGQTFNSIPAPGALPLIGFAVMFAARRRRPLSPSLLSPALGGMNP